MKTPSSQGFIIAAIIYAIAFVGGYWALTQNLSANDQSSDSLRDVAVTLSMFQPTVQEKTEPKVIPTEPIKERPDPVKEPEIIEPTPEAIEKVTEDVVEEIVDDIIEKVVEEPVQELEPEQLEEVAPAAKQPLKQPVAEVIPEMVKPQFSQQQIATAEQLYLSELREQIAEHALNTYPMRAKRRHWEGSVMLEFTLLANGQIKDVRIVSSSGRQILDNAATTILQSKMNNQFRPFPEEIQRKQWRIKLPVGYHLR